MFLVTKLLKDYIIIYLFFLLSKTRQAKTEHMEMKILQPIFGILVALTKNEVMEMCNEPGTSFKQDLIWVFLDKSSCYGVKIELICKSHFHTKTKICRNKTKIHQWCFAQFLAGWLIFGYSVRKLYSQNDVISPLSLFYLSQPHLKYYKCKGIRWLFVVYWHA